MGTMLVFVLPAIQRADISFSSSQCVRYIGFLVNRVNAISMTVKYMYI